MSLNLPGLKVGLRGELRVMVKDEHLADRYGNKGVKVLGTPTMIGFMEHASLNALRPIISPDLVSVGTLVNIRHLSATPPGAELVVKSTIVEIDRRRVVFAVEAYDAAGKIGEGTHERFILDAVKFFEKIKAKNRK